MPDVWEELARAREELLEECRKADLHEGGKLRCVECEVVDDGGRGWRTYLTVDNEPASYCPECAEAEFDA